jgi:hypothetical protein
VKGFCFDFLIFDRLQKKQGQQAGKDKVYCAQEIKFDSATKVLILV